MNIVSDSTEYTLAHVWRAVSDARAVQAAYIP